ncbi:MAG: TIGR04283 family arsenosugar biosynthesis glycosyltransferase [Pseudomonadota bacterium]
MRAPISIVIPTLNAGAELPETLAALTEGLSDGLVRDLVITDGGSSDDTRAIADAAGAIWVEGAPGRGGQLRRGCAAACGAWLLVLHADTHLSPGWARVVAQALRDPEHAHVFRLAFRTERPGAHVLPEWTAGWANLRTRAFGLAYGDQGVLMTRALYDTVGGYADIPLMEDVALMRVLPRRPRLMPAEARTSAARYEAEGWLRRGTRNLWTFARYRAGVSPVRLARSYRKR